MSSIAPALREKIHRAAAGRCGYCLSPQELVLGVLEIDHIIPVSEGGSDDEENLWLACRACNIAKRTKTKAIDPLTGRVVQLFNPRQQNWWEHFTWSVSGLEIVGITATGRATVVALNLNNIIALMVRRNWLKTGLHPPKNNKSD